MMTLAGPGRRHELVRFLPGGRVASGGAGLHTHEPERKAPGVAVWGLADPAAPPAVWDADGNEVTALAAHPAVPWLFAATTGWHPGISGGLFAFDSATGAAVPVPGSRFVHHLAFSPDGARLFAGTKALFGYGPDRRTAGPPLLVCRDVAAGPPFPVAWAVENTDLMVLGLDAFPDGSRLVTAEGRGVYTEDEVTLRVRSAADGRVLHEAESPNSQVQQVAVAPDGRQVVVRSNMTLIVWDNPELEGRPRKRTNDNRKHFMGAAFHPSVRVLAAAGNDATVKFWDAATWAVAKTFTWKAGKMRSVAFSPDGLLAAAGTDAGSVVVWDVDG